MNTNKHNNSNNTDKNRAKASKALQTRVINGTTKAKPAKKTAKPAKKKTTKPATTPASKARIVIMGHTLTQFCRGLGKAGFKAADAIKAIHRIEPKAPETTIRSQIGKSKAPDTKCTLKRTQIAEMRKLAKAA